MNDDVRLERIFADGLHELAPRRAPDRLRTTIKAETAEARPRARWLALTKEPSMRMNSRIAVGSPTLRAAAILAATLLLAVTLVAAGMAGQRLLAADNGTIVVAQDGSGDYTTITEAVAAAVEGDEVLVRPGTYAEALVIDKDITLRGDGPVDEVVIELADAVLIQLVDSIAEVADLTLRGDELTSGIEVLGGAPFISGIVFDRTGRPYAGGACMAGREACGGSSLDINGGAPLVVGNRFVGGGEVSIDGDANATISGNVLTDGPHIVSFDPGDGAIIRRNTISKPNVRGIGVYGEGALLIENNVITASGNNGIDIDYLGTSPRIVGNTISLNGQTGISVSGGSSPEISGNTLTDNATAINWAGRDGVIADNVVKGGKAGIVVTGSPGVSGNTVEGVQNRGFIFVGTGTTPVLTGNRACDNGENLFVDDLAEPAIDDSNAICEDEPAA